MGGEEKGEARGGGGERKGKGGDGREGEGGEAGEGGEGRDPKEKFWLRA